MDRATWEFMNEVEDYELEDQEYMAMVNDFALEDIKNSESEYSKAIAKVA